MRKFFWLAGLALGANAAQAQTIEFTLNPDVTGGYGLLDEAALEQAVNDNVGDLLKVADQDAFTSSMAEAASMSVKGLGVDYASNIQKFVVGGAISSGVHAAGLSFKKGTDVLPSGGFAGQLSLMAGVNLGLGGKEKGFFDRFRLYGNGLALRFPSGREFGGNMANVGAHLQVKIIGGIDAKVTEWGGIDVTSGFDYTTYTLALRSELPLPAPVEGGDLTWNATGSYDLTTTATSIPIEVSTNVRVAILTAYLGGAYDLNMASTSSQASLAGPVNATIESDAVSINDENIGEASLSLAGSGVADPQAMRVFLGIQGSVLMIKGFAHLNVGFNGAIGGQLGVRVAM